MAFVKLDTAILNSTLWADRTVRDVFITALLMAEPWEVDKTEAQLEVDALTPTGWCVPPGWYGFVRAAGVGILRLALVDEDEGREALRALGSPDLESRSADFDGRRLVRINGGYVVLNYMKYRERDITAADRAKRYRDAKKAAAALRRDVTGEHPNVTDADADADADAEKREIPLPPSGEDRAGLEAEAADIWRDCAERIGGLRLTLGIAPTELYQLGEIVTRYSLADVRLAAEHYWRSKRRLKTVAFFRKDFEAELAAAKAEPTEGPRVTAWQCQKCGEEHEGPRKLYLAKWCPHERVEVA